ncbi:hypothetical protein C5167_013488, partial [Papaver somniferum]
METPKIMNFGGSLSVPSVQELAKQSPAKIPARYRRNDLDFTLLAKNGVVNHGVDSSLVEKVKSEIQDFFNFSLDEKMKFCQEEGDLEGYGQAFVHSEDQKLDWADMFYILTLPQHPRKPRLLPKLPLPL